MLEDRVFISNQSEYVEGGVCFKFQAEEQITAATRTRIKARTLRHSEIEIVLLNQQNSKFPANDGAWDNRR